MQETWAAVVRGIHRLNDPARFRSWIYRIVGNKSADWIRSNQARRRLHSQVARESKSVTSVTSVTLESGADENVIGTLRELFRTLPIEKQTILSMFYLDEMSVAEMGFALQIPEGTVKSRLFHARRMLKEALET
jgi:RNA polymerase sigma-70 factor (ECF subfamily)